MTSNTTTALAMVYHGLRIRQGQEVLTTEHDHYSHHESIRYAAARSGCGVRYIALFDTPAAARADQIVERIARAITPATRAVGVTWVQSSTGIKLPIAGIAEAVARTNRGRTPADRCLLIVDGVHGFANQDVDIARLGADFFASGGHKWLFAPRGTGFLWGRSDAWPELRPTIPSFDPDTIDTTFGAWGARTELPPPHDRARPHRESHCRIERRLSCRRRADSRSHVAHATRSGAVRRNLMLRGPGLNPWAGRGASCGKEDSHDNISV